MLPVSKDTPGAESQGGSLEDAKPSIPDDSISNHNTGGGGADAASPSPTRLQIASSPNSERAAGGVARGVSSQGAAAAERMAQNWRHRALTRRHEEIFQRRKSAMGSATDMNLGFLSFMSKGNFKGGKVVPRSSIGSRNGLTHDEEAIAETLERASALEQATRRRKLVKYLEQSIMGAWLGAVSALVSIVGMALYIYMTYEYVEEDLSTFLWVCDWIITAFFICEYVLRLYIAESRIVWMMGPAGIVDLLSCFAAPLEAINGSPPGSSLHLHRLSRALRVVRILRVHRLLDYSDSEVQRHLFMVLFTVVNTICVTGAILHTVEVDSVWTRVNEEIVGLSFHNACYLVVITMTTVGYGDFSPETLIGKGIIVCCLGFTFVAVPYQMNSLMALLSMKSLYARARYKRHASHGHVLVVGNISHSVVMDFLREFFHEDHGNTEMMVVFLDNKTPTGEMLQLLKTPPYLHQLKYIEGSPMNKRDLERACAKEAAACFVLSNKFCVDPDVEDAGNILRALSIKHNTRGKRGKGDLRTLVQLIRPENKHHFVASMNSGVSAIDQIVCIDEMKFNLLGVSCMCPGFSTMMGNLITSSNDEPPADMHEPEVWHHEYCHGSGFEIYRTPLSPIFDGETFGDVALLVYEVFQSVLFGLEIEDQNGGNRMCIVPMDYKVTSSSMGFVIAPDVQTALQISVYMMEDDESNGAEPHGRNSKVMHSRRGSTIAWELSHKQQRDTDSPPDRKGDSPGRAGRGGTRVPTTEGAGADLGLQLDGVVPNAPSSQQAGVEGSDDHLWQNMAELDHRMRAGQREGGGPSPRTSAVANAMADYGANPFDSVQGALVTKAVLGPQGGGGGWGGGAMDELMKGAGGGGGGSIREVIERLNALRSNYYTRPAISLEEGTLLDCGDLRGHIVILGPESLVPGLWHLIAPLRRRHLKAIQPIIIMVQRLPQRKLWEKINMMAEVFLIEGSPHEYEDLQRVNVKEASRAVILAPTYAVQTGELETLVDADTIFTFQHLKRLAPDVQVLTELVAPSNMSFLQPNVMFEASEHYMAPPFASGTVYTATLLDTLICQAYYNRDILTILRVVVTGGGDVTSMRSMDGQVVDQGFVCQIPVGPAFVGRTYHEYFVHLLAERKMVCLGLWRCSGKQGNSLPYVYTNPAAETVLDAEDFAFVLTTEQPVEAAAAVETVLLDEHSRPSSRAEVAEGGAPHVPRPPSAPRPAQSHRDGGGGGAGGEDSEGEEGGERKIVPVSIAGSNEQAASDNPNASSQSFDSAAPPGGSGARRTGSAGRPAGRVKPRTGANSGKTDERTLLESISRELCLLRREVSQLKATKATRVSGDTQEKRASLGMDPGPGL